MLSNGRAFHLFLFVFLTTVHLSEEAFLDYFNISEWKTEELVNNITIKGDSGSKGIIECSLREHCDKSKHAHSNLCAIVHSDEIKTFFTYPCNEISSNQEVNISAFHLICLIAELTNRSHRVSECTNYDFLKGFWTLISARRNSSACRQTMMLPTATTTTPPQSATTTPQSATTTLQSTAATTPQSQTTTLQSTMTTLQSTTTPQSTPTLQSPTTTFQSTTTTPQSTTRNVTTSSNCCKCCDKRALTTLSTTTTTDATRHSSEILQQKNEPSEAYTETTERHTETLKGLLVISGSLNILLIFLYSWDKRRQNKRQTMRTNADVIECNVLHSGDTVIENPPNKCMMASNESVI